MCRAIVLHGIHARSAADLKVTYCVPFGAVRPRIFFLPHNGNWTMRNCGWLLFVVLVGCGSANQPTSVRTQPAGDKQQPAAAPPESQTIAVAPVTSQVERIQDLLGPWPISLAFYEKRPIQKGHRQLHSVSLSQSPGFKVRIDLAADDATVAAVQFFGVEPNEASEARAHHISVVLGDELCREISQRELRRAIFDAGSFADRKFPVTICDWTITIEESNLTNHRTVRIVRR